MNTLELFEQLDIPFTTSGKNISRGWIAIACPYPFCSDPSAHMGVNLQSGLHSCWVCGSKGSMEKLLHHIMKISYAEAADLLLQYGWYKASPKATATPASAVKVEFPLQCTRSLPEPHCNYLRKRNFDPDHIMRKYKVRACWQTGYFSYRIVIPVFENSTLVNITGRDITDKQQLRYKTLPNKDAVKTIKSCIYNIDSVKDTAVIVEGPTDVWRIGDGAVATFGTAVTTEQLIALLDKKIQRAFVMFDRGAERKAREVAGKLSSFIKSVDILQPSSDDPDTMTETELEEVQKILSEIEN